MTGFQIDFFVPRIFFSVEGGSSNFEGQVEYMELKSKSLDNIEGLKIANFR